MNNISIKRLWYTTYQATRCNGFVDYESIDYRILEGNEYRLTYGINSIEDCTCASEEYLCGFISDDEQLDLFIDYTNSIDEITR